MSVGTIIGGVVGGVVGGIIGGFIGGPPGVAIGISAGMSLGFGVGMLVDPLSFDIPNPTGAPLSPEAGQAMSSTVGGPVPDLVGSAKITGHLLCYGKERSEPIYQEQSGGGGGKGGGGGDDPPPVIIGYRYYMSWAIGIAMGPVDTLYAVYKNDDIVWEGELYRPLFCGKEVVSLTGMGSASFFFGTDDHQDFPPLADIISDPTLNTPYRGLCWCYLDDCYIGEYNRAPTIRFIVKKIPKNDYCGGSEIAKYDCNAAHALWYILHDLVRLDESWLHSGDFAAIARTLSLECRGISVFFDKQQSALSYIDAINVHVENMLRYGIDGKIHPKLIRNDYDIDTLPLIDEDVMLEEPSFNRKSWIDTINEVRVQYNEIVDERPCGLTLWSWGDNSHGQLGLGDNIPRNIPTQVPPLPVDTWAHVACDDVCNFSSAIKSDGTLWGTGGNSWGELGVNDTNDRNEFVQEHLGATTWEQIISGAG